MYLIQIGFFTITLWDFLDVAIVGILLYRVYKLLKGSLGFNIFLGLAFIYIVWWLVGALDMFLLHSILTQFISVGMIALLVVFQPEVRRFLLLVGQNSFRARFKFFERLLKTRQDGEINDSKKEETIRAIIRATEQMAAEKTGALMLFSTTSSLEGLYSSGVLLGADITTPLIISIFNKESPLHDGATIFSDGKIVAASCVLPVSDNPNIPQKLGLRHRAAVGITESTDVLAFTVSEETGKISYARSGQITPNISLDNMRNLLRKVIQ